jgi:CBS domain-containing protein
VFDYAAGEADWLASGLPTEGASANKWRAKDALRAGVPTCALKDRLAEVRVRTHERGWDQCVVTNDHRIVLGRLREAQLDGDPARPIEDIMESGPSTFRPDIPLEELVERMRPHGTESVLVTTSDGELLGVVYRQDAERLLDQGQQATA